MKIPVDSGPQVPENLFHPRKVYETSHVQGIIRPELSAPAEKFSPSRKAAKEGGRGLQ